MSRLNFSTQSSFENQIDVATLVELLTAKLTREKAPYTQKILPVSFDLGGKN